MLDNYLKGVDQNGAQEAPDEKGRVAAVADEGTSDIPSRLIILATFGLTFACRDDMHGHTFAC